MSRGYCQHIVHCTTIDPDSLIGSLNLTASTIEGLTPVGRLRISKTRIKDSGRVLYTRPSPKPHQARRTTIHTINISGLLNGTTGLGGDAVVGPSSDVPGRSQYAHHTMTNGTELVDYNVVIFHSLESPPITPPAPRPRGVIMLEQVFSDSNSDNLLRNRLFFYFSHSHSLVLHSCHP